jgi:hypothetical protein
MLIPRQEVPALKLETLSTGSAWLAKSANFTLLVSIGLHCPICAKYLLELARLLL